MGAPAILTVMKGGETVKTCPIQGEVLLGREEGCAIRLNDRAVSRQHALFRSIGDSVQVEKKSEFAPFAVNGAECTRAVLKEGDVISIGPYLIRVSTSPPPSAQMELSPEPVVPIAEQELPVEQNTPLQMPPLPESPIESEVAFTLASPSDEVISSSIEELSPPQNSMLDIPFEAPDLVAQSPAEPEVAVQQIEADENSNFTLQPPGEFNEEGNTKVASAGKIVIKLFFKEGAANYTTYEINREEISIGRGKNCDIVLNDKKVSRKNAIIRRVGLNYTIKDLASANGTYVNGARIQEQKLSGEDVIRIGNIEFQCKAVSAEYEKREKNFLSVPEVEIPSLNLPNLNSPEPVEVAPVLNIPPRAPFSMPADGGIAGIVGIGGNSTQKKTLTEKFKALPKRTQIIAVVAALMFIWWFMEEDGMDTPKKKAPAKQAGATAPSGAPPISATFESLPPDKKQFIESQHALAFDLYKNQEYDKALVEIQKIFILVSDYKDAREIERYAKEGKRKQEARLEEQRKKEEEAKIKAQVAQLVEEAKGLMEKKEYEQAKELFVEILTLDPENVIVADWRKIVEEYEEQVRVQEQAKQVQMEINKHGWEIFKEAMEFKEENKYHSAIESFQKSIDIGTSDKKLISRSKSMIALCRSLIRRRRDPILAQAKQMEEAGEFSKAFALYQKATRIDPPHPAGYAGINRIKGILHDRAKAVYTEAVLAESYSDFTNAKKMFQECLQIAPKDDVYHERAERKLSHYFRKDEAPIQ